MFLSTLTRFSVTVVDGSNAKAKINKINHLYSVVQAPPGYCWKGLVIDTMHCFTKEPHLCKQMQKTQLRPEIMAIFV